MILLDTAVWVNRALCPALLPAKIHRLLDGKRVQLCSVSLLEAAMLHRKGRLALAGTLAEFYQAALARDVELAELTPAIAAATNDLGADFHGDPFDRTIAATAREMDWLLVTTDPLIAEAKVCRVEFYPFKPAAKA